MLKNMLWQWESVIPKEVCDAIIKTTPWENAKKAEVGNHGQERQILDIAARDTDIVWEHGGTAIAAILKNYIALANQHAEWNFVINDIEQIQMGRYGVGGHYEWHADTYTDPMAGVPDENGIIKVPYRKLSISMLLNDPSEFEGGALKLRNFTGEESSNILTTQGSIVVFPSFLHHIVEPVTAGTRYTAVTWANGPSFR